MMVFKCDRGQRKKFVFRKMANIRLGGCAANGRFVVKEVTKIKRRLK